MLFAREFLPCLRVLQIPTMQMLAAMPSDIHFFWMWGRNSVLTCSSSSIPFVSERLDYLSPVCFICLSQDRHTNRNVWLWCSSALNWCMFFFVFESRQGSEWRWTGWRTVVRSLLLLNWHTSMWTQAVKAVHGLPPYWFHDFAQDPWADWRTSGWHRPGKSSELRTALATEADLDIVVLTYEMNLPLSASESLNDTRIPDSIKKGVGSSGSRYIPIRLCREIPGQCR